jgi:organic radical activating enzyme
MKIWGVTLMEKVVDQLRWRYFPKDNYAAFYNKGEVIRFYIDEEKEMGTPPVPEFMDISITHKCTANCTYCYQRSTENGEHSKDPIDRLSTYFSGIPKNELPFQIAYGGGEPTLHPEFIDILRWTAEQGIVPNYTTNGMHLTKEILEATEKYAGGAAVTCHPHLEKTWRAGFNKIAEVTNPCLHLLISDLDSIIYATDIIREYKSQAYAIVMLPFANQGRASSLNKTVDYVALEAALSLFPDKDLSKIAWGAGFYPWLKDHSRMKNLLSLYEPEQFSLYLDLVTMKEYPSSFSQELLND